MEQPLRNGTSNPGKPRARPAVPVAPKTAPQSSPVPAAPNIAPIEDDLVFVPAPTIDMLARTRRAPAKGRQSVRIIQTFVPILLTMGCTFEALGLLWYTTGSDSPFRLIGRWLPITLLVAGVCMVSLGLANVMYLKKHLQKR